MITGLYSTSNMALSNKNPLPDNIKINSKNNNLNQNAPSFCALGKIFSGGAVIAGISYKDIHDFGLNDFNRLGISLGVFTVILTTIMGLWKVFTQKN